MNKAILLGFIATLVVLANCVPLQYKGTDDEKFVGGYVLLSRTSRGTPVGLEEVALLAQQAATLPLNRIWFGFFAPTMVYFPGSNTLQNAGLNISSTGDYGFAALKDSISKLQAGGVEVFLSMGGWNYNCFPYMYAYYSVGGYGTHTPNYWKVEQFGHGNLSGCVDDNQYCYVCEPPSEGTTLDAFQIFPEPQYSPTWQQAANYVQQNANATYPPAWNYDLVPGQKWTDPKTGISVTVPGNGQYASYRRDPYQDLVYLAKDLGADGIDLDYEEFWHGDYYKIQTGAATGPWVLPQTAYKYTAIAQDLIINIKQIYPTCKLSTAAGAVGAWSTNWWGGNLKSLWFDVNLNFPDVIAFMATGPNAGGINVMTYDLSDNTEFHECPEDDACPLDAQVAFYMGTYSQAQIKASVGYEIGTPAYPDPTHDKEHQLPLTNEMLTSIISKTQPGLNAFFWELFKAPNDPDNVSPTTLAQALCNVVLTGSPRCTGTIPNVTYTKYF